MATKSLCSREDGEEGTETLGKSILDDAENKQWDVILPPQRLPGFDGEKWRMEATDLQALGWRKRTIVDDGEHGHREFQTPGGRSNRYRATTQAHCSTARSMRHLSTPKSSGVPKPQLLVLLPEF
jgi:hypothetical protein